jgi:hypothetical protein
MRFSLGGIRFADDEGVEMKAPKWLRQQSKDLHVVGQWSSRTHRGKTATCFTVEYQSSKYSLWEATHRSQGLIHPSKQFWNWFCGMAFRATVVLLLMSSVSSKCLISIFALSSWNRINHWGLDPMNRGVFRHGYFFTSYKLPHRQCSSVRSFGTIFAHAFLMSRYSAKILLSVSLSMLACSAMFQTVSWRFLHNLTNICYVSCSSAPSWESWCLFVSDTVFPPKNVSTACKLMFPS